MSRAKRIRRALGRHPDVVCPDCRETLTWSVILGRYVNQLGTSLCPAKDGRRRSYEHTIPGRRRQNTAGPSYR